MSKQATSPRHTRRAVVLLVVLACVVGATAALASLAQDAATATTASKASFEWRVADDLMEACDAPIRHWLANVSHTVVLPSDARSPMVVLLDDRLDLIPSRARLMIIAYDACGPNRLNISTAPLSDIERAIADEELGGLDAIVAARREGRLPPLPRGRAIADGELRVSYVNTSPRWEMRIAITVGAITREWHAVYVNAGESWELQSRKVADE